MQQKASIATICCAVTAGSAWSRCFHKPRFRPESSLRLEAHSFSFCSENVMNKTTTLTAELEQKWNRLTSHFLGITPYPVWQYLQGQNVEALVDRREQFLKDIKLASSLEERVPRIAFAVRDCAGNPVNILLLELDGLILLATVGRRYRLLSKDASIAGASVHFGEPNEELSVAVSVESAMAIVIATNGVPCWACLGPTGLKTLKVPETVTKVRIFCDVEPSGIMEEAAAVLADRIKKTGRTVFVLTPPCSALGLVGKVCWHDAWMMAGRELLHL